MKSYRVYVTLVEIIEGIMDSDRRSETILKKPLNVGNDFSEAQEVAESAIKAGKEKWSQIIKATFQQNMDYPPMKIKGPLEEE